MTRLMRPDPKDAPFLEEIRGDKHTLQRGSLNDPITQDGRLYLNAAHTAYIYLDGYHLFFQPENESSVEIA